MKRLPRPLRFFLGANLALLAAIAPLAWPIPEYESHYDEGEPVPCRYVRRYEMLSVDRWGFGRKYDTGGDGQNYRVTRLGVFAVIDARLARRQRGV